MFLTVCDPGHVADAIDEAVQGVGETARAARIDDPDLFMKALDCDAIVYAPEPRLLDASTAGDVERMRAIVRAAHAPGVRHVVVVLPEGDGREDETRVLKKDGVGYTILASRPLVDELADAANLHAARSVWLPRGTTIELASRAALVSAIRDALTRDDLCGASVHVPSERMEIAAALARAAALAGAQLHVHVTSPSVSFAMRKLSAWMGLASPELEHIVDRLAGARTVHAAA